MNTYQRTDVRWVAELNRAEWGEGRPGSGFFLIIAEKHGEQWKFWERDAWEVAWYPLVCSKDRVATAEQAFNRRRGGNACASALAA
jgi:hypothetical protein